MYRVALHAVAAVEQVYSAADYEKGCERPPTPHTGRIRKTGKIGKS